MAYIAISTLPPKSPIEKQQILLEVEKAFNYRRRIEIQGIPPHLKANDIARIMLKNLDHEDIFRDKEGQVHILFSSPQLAEKALVEFKGKNFNDRPMVVCYSQSTYLLCVVNLPYDYTVNQLQNVMQTFGKIERIFIVHCETTGHSKGYGFVEFVRKFDAERARKEFKLILNDREVHIHYANYGIFEYAHIHSSTLFVDNLTANTTTEDLKKLFDSTGKTSFCKIVNTKSLNYALVDLFSASDAEAAWFKHDGAILHDKPIRVSFFSPARTGISCVEGKHNMVPQLKNLLVPKSQQTFTGWPFNIGQDSADAVERSLKQKSAPLTSIEKNSTENIQPNSEKAKENTSTSSEKAVQSNTDAISLKDQAYSKKPQTLNSAKVNLKPEEKRLPAQSIPPLMESLVNNIKVDDKKIMGNSSNDSSKFRDQRSFFVNNNSNYNNNNNNIADSANKSGGINRGIQPLMSAKLLPPNENQQNNTFPRPNNPNLSNRPVNQPGTMPNNLQGPPHAPWQQGQFRQQGLPRPRGPQGTPIKLESQNTGNSSIQMPPWKQPLRSPGPGQVPNQRMHDSLFQQHSSDENLDGQTQLQHNNNSRFPQDQTPPRFQSSHDQLSRFKGPPSQNSPQFQGIPQATYGPRAPAGQPSFRPQQPMQGPGQASLRALGPPQDLMENSKSHVGMQNQLTSKQQGTINHSKSTLPGPPDQSKNTPSYLQQTPPAQRPSFGANNSSNQSKNWNDQSNRQGSSSFNAWNDSQERQWNTANLSQSGQPDFQNTKTQNLPDVKRKRPSKWDQPDDNRPNQPQSGLNNQPFSVQGISSNKQPKWEDNANTPNTWQSQTHHSNKWNQQSNQPNSRSNWSDEKSGQKNLNAPSTGQTWNNQNDNQQSIGSKPGWNDPRPNSVNSGQWNKQSQNQQSQSNQASQINQQSDQSSWNNQAGGPPRLILGTQNPKQSNWNKQDVTHSNWDNRDTSQSNWSNQSSRQPNWEQQDSTQSIWDNSSQSQSSWSNQNQVQTNWNSQNQNQQQASQSPWNKQIPGQPTWNNQQNQQPAPPQSNWNNPSNQQSLTSQQQQPATSLNNDVPNQQQGSSMQWSSQSQVPLQQQPQQPAQQQANWNANQNQNWQSSNWNQPNQLQVPSNQTAPLTVPQNPVSNTMQPIQTAYQIPGLPAGPPMPDLSPEGQAAAQQYIQYYQQYYQSTMGGMPGFDLAATMAQITSYAHSYYSQYYSINNSANNQQSPAVSSVPAAPAVPSVSAIPPVPILSSAPVIPSSSIGNPVAKTNASFSASGLPPIPGESSLQDSTTTSYGQNNQKATTTTTGLTTNFWQNYPNQASGLTSSWQNQDTSYNQQAGVSQDSYSPFYGQQTSAVSSSSFNQITSTTSTNTYTQNNSQQLYNSATYSQPGNKQGSSIYGNKSGIGPNLPQQNVKDVKNSSMSSLPSQQSQFSNYQNLQPGPQPYQPPMSLQSSNSSAIDQKQSVTSQIKNPGQYSDQAIRQTGNFGQQRSNQHQQQTNYTQQQYENTEQNTTNSWDQNQPNKTTNQGNFSKSSVQTFDYNHKSTQPGAVMRGLQSDSYSSNPYSQTPRKPWSLEQKQRPSPSHGTSQQPPWQK